MRSVKHFNCELVSYHILCISKQQRSIAKDIPLLFLLAAGALPRTKIPLQTDAGGLNQSDPRYAALTSSLAKSSCPEPVMVMRPVSITKP